MASTKTKRVLRVTLLRKGEVYDEVVLLEPQSVSIGTSDKNTFVSPISTDLPDTFILFEYLNGSYSLKIPEGMVGKISLGESEHPEQNKEKRKQLQPLEDVKKRGAQEGPNLTLPLPNDAFGFLAFREKDPEHKVMFKFDNITPPKFLFTMPSALKGGIFTEILGNRVLIVGVLISIILQSAFLAYIISNDWPKPREMDRVIPDRFVTILQDIQREEEEELVKLEEQKKEGDDEKDGDNGDEEEKEEVKQEKPDKEKPSASAPDEINRRRKLNEQVMNKTVLGQIGSINENGGGFADLLAEGVDNKKMEEAFAGSTGVTMEAADADSSSLRTGRKNADGVAGAALGMGSIGSGSGRGDMARTVGSGVVKRERKVTAAVRAQRERVVGGTLSPDAIARVIARRISRIRACYERHLKKDPAARGKVVVQFTIGSVGRVTDSRATQDSVGGGVGSCVATEIQRMRFPKPEGGDATVSKSFVFESN